MLCAFLTIFLQKISSKSHHHHTEENRGVEEVSGTSAISIASAVGFIRAKSVAILATDTTSLWIVVVRQALVAVVA
jgi:hypothetical protein